MGTQEMCCEFRHCWRVWEICDVNLGIWLVLKCAEESWCYGCSIVDVHRRFFCCECGHAIVGVCWRLWCQCGCSIDDEVCRIVSVLWMFYCWCVQEIRGVVRDLEQTAREIQTIMQAIHQAAASEHGLIDLGFSFLSLFYLLSPLPPSCT